MKSYTDLNQSKKLAEFLPLESADIHYNNVSIKGINYVDEHRAELMEYNRAIKVLSKYTINPLFEVIPCWSLSALLNTLPRIVNNETLFVETSPSLWHIGYRNVYIARAVNLVDACYEMICWLKKNKRYDKRRSKANRPKRNRRGD